MKNCQLLLIWLLPILITACTQKEKSAQSDSLSATLKTTLAPEYQQLIGMEFREDSLPSGFVEHTGYVLGLMEEHEYIVDHISKGEDQLIWLCRLIRRDNEGIIHLKILDILALPPLSEDEQLLLGTCSYQSQPDPEIIAIVKFIESEVRNEIRHAWRINRGKQLFEKIPVSLVECHDESLYL